MPPVTPRRIRLPCIEGLIHAVDFDYPAPPIDRQKSPVRRLVGPDGPAQRVAGPTDAPDAASPRCRQPRMRQPRMRQPRMGQPGWARAFADISPFLAPS